MTQYLISFQEGWMQLTEEDFPAVAAAANAVVNAAKDAGVYVTAGGMNYEHPVNLVTPAGDVSDIVYSESTVQIGGFTIVDVPTREEALDWAARIAVACRCDQEVREFI